jgi:hypothetical protein
MPVDSSRVTIQGIDNVSHLRGENEDSYCFTYQAISAEVPDVSVEPNFA